MYCSLFDYTGKIKLSHFSVKEYLLSSWIDKNIRFTEKAAHTKITQISVAYLLQFQSFEPMTQSVLNNAPLANYAAENWFIHAQNGEYNAVNLKLMLELFNNNVAPYINWMRIYNIDGNWWKRQNLAMNESELITPLYCASSAGIKEVVQLLIVKGANVNAQDGKYGHSLQAAVYKGHKEIAKLLIVNGANVNAKGGEYSNALQAAALGGHQAIVELLIANGANVNAEGGDYGNALQAAAYRGHQAIVELLIANGANVNAEGGDYGNALQAAASGGHQALVELLIAKGANVNAQGGPYGNALLAAKLYGRMNIVELLSEKGAVNVVF